MRTHFFVTVFFKNGNKKTFKKYLTDDELDDFHLRLVERYSESYEVIISKPMKNLS